MNNLQINTKLLQLAVPFYQIKLCMFSLNTSPCAIFKHCYSAEQEERSTTLHKEEQIQVVTTLLTPTKL